MATSNLLNHLRLKHPTATKNDLESCKSFDEKQEKQLTLEAAFSKKFAQEEFEKLLVSFIAESNSAFNIVSLESFKTLIKYLNPNAKVVSPQTMKNRVEKEFDNLKKEVFEEFKEAQSKISFTTDCWTKNHQPFSSFTGTFIDDAWQLKNQILDFIPLKGSHTGARLCEAFENVVRDDYQIENSNHGCITLDSAANNIKMLELYCEKYKMDDTLGNRCAAHAINLAVQAALIIIKPIIDNFREGIRRIRASNKFLDRLETVYSELNNGSENYVLVQLDCPTRWNSTVDMLKIGVKNTKMKEPLKVTTIIKI